MNSVITTPHGSASSLYTLAAAQLRIDNPNERDLIIQKIDAAIGFAEDEMNCSLIAQTITDTFWNIEIVQPTGLVSQNGVKLMNGPLISVTSVTDAKGSITNYTVQHFGFSDYICLPNGFAEPLHVVYQAGIASSAATIPAKFIEPILAHVTALYLNRASITDKQMYDVPQSLRDFYRNNARITTVA